MNTDTQFGPCILPCTPRFSEPDSLFYDWHAECALFLMQLVEMELWADVNNSLKSKGFKTMGLVQCPSTSVDPAG